MYILKKMAECSEALTENRHLLILNTEARLRLRTEGGARICNLEAHLNRLGCDLECAYSAHAAVGALLAQRHGAVAEAVEQRDLSRRVCFDLISKVRELSQRHGLLMNILADKMRD